MLGSTNRFVGCVLALKQHDIAFHAQNRNSSHFSTSQTLLATSVKKGTLRYRIQAFRHAYSTSFPVKQKRSSLRLSGCGAAMEPKFDSESLLPERIAPAQKAPGPCRTGLTRNEFRRPLALSTCHRSCDPLQCQSPEPWPLPHTKPALRSTISKAWQC